MSTFEKQTTENIFNLWKNVGTYFYPHKRMKGNLKKMRIILRSTYILHTYDTYIEVHTYNTYIG